MNAGLARRLALALAIGAAGGALFATLRMPLAWMLGSMVFTTAVSLSGTVALEVPRRLRALMSMILGVLLGSAFTPEIIEAAGEWPVTLAALAVYLALVTGLLMLYFRRVLGFDPVTAYFSATPGGLTEMVITGAAMGGDDRSIALVHAARVLVTVLAIPFWFRFMTGVVTTASSAGPSIASVTLSEAALLVLCAVVGAVAGRALRLPAYRLVGPMIASAAAHASGLTDSRPPYEVVAAAQVVLGAAVGARFRGVELGRMARIVAASCGSTAIMLVAGVAFAFGLARLTGLDWHAIVLAYSPGGLAEMSLIALALGYEVAFVATHHAVRISLIVVGAPFVFRLIRRSGAGPPAPPPAPPATGAHRPPRGDDFDGP